METLKDWKRAPHGGEVWIHSLDLLTHLMAMDFDASAFKAIGEGNREDCRVKFERLRQEFESYKQDEAFTDIKRECLAKPRKRRRTRRDRSGDDLHVESYIDARAEGTLDTSRIWDTRYTEMSRRKPALSLLIEGGIPWGMRSGKHMVARQREAYQLALQARAERRPCRVVITINCACPELPATKWCIVAKDFHEPIYPAVWGAFQTNKTANDLVCLLYGVIVGTRDGGLGWHTSYTPPKLPKGEEIVILDRENLSFLRP